MGRMVGTSYNMPLLVRHCVVTERKKAACVVTPSLRFNYQTKLIDIYKIVFLCYEVLFTHNVLKQSLSIRQVMYHYIYKITPSQRQKRTF